MRTSFALLLTFLIAVPLLAGDLTGRWAGEYRFKTPDGGADVGVAVCQMTQKGSEITGTAGPEEEQFPIRNGKVAGDQVTMEVVQPVEGGERVYAVALKILGPGKLEGTLKFKTAEGETIDGTLTLARK